MFGEFREVVPGKDAMPLGAVLVIALIILPAFLGNDTEDDVLVLVLNGLASRFCPRRPMRMTLLTWCWAAAFLFRLSAVCGTCLPNGCAVRPTPSVTGRNNWKRTPACLRDGVHTPKRRVADSGKKSVRPKGGPALSGRGQRRQKGTPNGVAVVNGHSI